MRAPAAFLRRGAIIPLWLLVSGLTSSCESGVAGGALQTVIDSMLASLGNGQVAKAGTPVAIPPAVLVESGNQPAAGVKVTFSVTTGGGSVTGATPVTNSAGIATVGDWTLGPTPGPNSLTATASGLSGSPVSFSATASASGLAWPNDPFSQGVAGWTLVSDYGFTDPLPDGSVGGQELGASYWFNDYGASITTGNLVTVSDPSSPVNPSTVLAFRYPTGFVAGVSPGTLYYYGPPGGWYSTGGTSQTYMGFWWKSSSNWYGEAASVNKLTEFFDNGSGSYFYEEYGQGANALHTFSVVENGDTTIDYPDNVDTTAIARGQWHQGEILWVYTGTNQGTLKRWVDGVLKASYANVPLGGTTFSSAEIYPDWGGGGDTLLTATQYQYFAHVRITGHP